MSDPVLVPMNVTYNNAWLSWVASTTACLNALEVPCDLVDVAGMSGYAFMLSVSNDLCPSGPTVFDWGVLEAGISRLGRSCLAFRTWDCHSKERQSETTLAHCRAAYDIVEREVRAGRPCVIWGAYVPEFAVAVGVQDGCFIVKSFLSAIGQPEPPIPFGDLNAPGGPYVLAFPTATTWSTSPHAGDQLAVGLACQLLKSPSPDARYGFGLAAYERWITALQQDIAHPFGNSYNAQCYCEGRQFAREFVARLAQRHPGIPALAEAHLHYTAAAQAMAQLVQLFPFPYQLERLPEADRMQAVSALQDARAAETAACDALQRALQAPWNAEATPATAG